VIQVGDLARAAREALTLARREPGLVEVEVFVAANAALLARLNYTSHIPSNGVEEPKSAEAWGLGIQAVFDTPDGRALGFGSEPSDLTETGVRRALDKARRAAVVDPDFVSLPEPSETRRRLADYHDPALMTLDDEALVGLGWRLIGGALRTFQTSSALGRRATTDETFKKLGLIVGGDVTVLQERIAIASTRMPEVQTDESTLITAFVTAMVEAYGAKGSGWSTGTRLDHFTDEAGVDAAQAAIAAIAGERVPTGRYTVLFGHQPIADIVNTLLAPACTSSSFYASSTPFLGRLGQQVASRLLSIYDDGAAPGLMGSKGITCEGLPTGRTDLIRDGAFVGCLSSWYDTWRLLRDPGLATKLGATGAAAATALVPRNGFRFGEGGGRQFGSPPGTSASNVVVEGRDTVSREQLIRTVRDGLYVGRIWYTYPINGLRAGDFTCTVVGDSYIIRDGRIAAPLRANVLRINDNIATILDNVVGVTRDVRGTIVWAADEVVYAPEIAVAGVRVEEIAVDGRADTPGGRTDAPGGRTDAPGEIC
jgi:predicted Zn-dependent protease